MDGTWGRAASAARDMLHVHAEELAAVASPLSARVWLVGGTVRDLLAGTPRLPLDVDVAVDGDVVALAKALAERTRGTYVPMAEERGTVRTVAGDGTVYDVSVVRGGSIEQDLAGRDFTVNAMAAPLDAIASGEAAHVIDPLGGLADLRAGIVRMTSAASLEDDPLRLMRAFRFAAVLDATVDPATFDAVRERASLAARPAPERITRELFLTLGVPASAPHVRAMDDAGVLPAVLPETALMRGVTQNEYHHLDVWLHSLESLACLEELLAELPSIVGAYAQRLGAFLAEEIVAERTRAALLKFATLLHDAGKPPMRDVRDGKVIFYGHTRRGAEMVRATCERLRLSARETAEATTWVDRHLVPADLVKTSPLTEKRCARFFRRNGESGLALLLLSLADAMATRGPASDPASIDRQRAFLRDMTVAYYEWAERRIEARPLVDGRELMAATGLPPGRELGRIVQAVREAQLEGSVGTRDQALAYACDLLAGRAGGISP